MPNITQIPAPRVPIIDEKTGLMSREWYRFFINIFQLTGNGSSNVSLEDLQVAPVPVETTPTSPSNTVQYNNAGSFAGSSNFTYDSATNTLTVGNVTGNAPTMTIKPQASGDAILALAGGAISDGNLFLNDALGNSFLQVKTATPGGARQMAFYGVTPVVRAAAYTQTFPTASRTVSNPTFTNLATTAATNVTPWGFSTQAQADDIATKVNQLAADVVILRQLINSLIDDSQAYGLAQ